MSKLLSDEVCNACRADSPKVTGNELSQMMQQLPDWNVVVKEGVPRLSRLFVFADFQEALRFTNSVGELAESVNHHPELVLEWGKVTVSWWTHAIQGLHRNDFIMAAKTDRL